MPQAEVWIAEMIGRVLAKPTGGFVDTLGRLSERSIK
jgi:hypothetical protein